VSNQENNDWNRSKVLVSGNKGMIVFGPGEGHVLGLYISGFWKKNWERERCFR